MHDPQRRSRRRAGWTRTMSFATSLPLLLAGLLAGCSSAFVPQPGPGPDPQGRYVTLTTPIVALADTQEHESTGYPLHDNDSAVDAYIEVAQRPPEQPLFGRRILEWALKQQPDEPFLHLGDVLDLSCRSEGERMRRIFLSAGRQGAILPGNHDGLMFGIYNYRILDAALDTDGKQWNRACRRGVAHGAGPNKTDHEALSKREFITEYLAEQVRIHGGDLERFDLRGRPGDHRLSWTHPDPKAFFSAIEASVLDDYRYADSFLAHRLRLPAAPGATRGVVVIGLDTNQAGLLVGAWDTLMGRSPGSMGHVHPDQVRAVTHWVLQAAAQGDIVVFAGHHNWQSLGLPTRLLLRNLMSNVAHPLVYLSAHTHRGFWAEHRVLDRRPILELNVSSLSDWPISWRRISFDYDETANRLRVRGSIEPSVGRPVDGDGALLAAWQAQSCGRVGVPFDLVDRADRELVARQRDTRGSLMQWLVSGLGPVCETCQQSMYEHAQSYQDAMLEAIMQLQRHLGPEAHALHEVKLPAWCGSQDLASCAKSVQAERATDFASHVDLFRRKAQLVDLLSTHLDDLKTPQASAYMTCRAVQSAKIDFDATDDARNNHRSEVKRRQEQYFRVEATVGLE